MLAVLANRGRHAAALSADDERLLDDWVAGRLGPDATDRAAGLVKRNVLAADHVLERRLQAAASQAPEAPPEIADRILDFGSSTHRPTRVSGWWQGIGRWRWPTIVGTAALASLLLVVSAPVVQRMLQTDAPLQVALITIADRGALFEPSDLRMRGTQSPAVVDHRFREAELTRSLLEQLLGTSGQVSPTTRRALETSLPFIAGRADRPVHLVVDAALRDGLTTNPNRSQFPIRIYDLSDPRAADIRRMIDLPRPAENTYLLTSRP